MDCLFYNNKPLKPMRYSFLILLVLSFNQVFAQYKITGVVANGHTKKKIKDAQIYIDGKGIMTTSDKKGKFAITVNDTSDLLVVTAVNYASAILKVGNANKVNATLYPLSLVGQSLEMPYHSQNSNQITSSISVIKNRDFNVNTSSDIYAYLRGKVPGLSIIPNPNDPMSPPRIMLRGTGSFSGTYDPLIIVNGVQNVSIQSIDPNDVASVSVLKDGSAQALYGSQASGGVIIIKTK